MRDGKFKRFVVFTISILSVALCIGITLQSGNVDKETKTLNVLFFAGMILLILISRMGGIKKIRKINNGFQKGYDDLSEMEKLGRVDLESFQFEEAYLKERYEEYTRYVKGHGDTDIGEFINEYDIGVYAGKKFLEVVPDILTSAGILGTFIGLVVGLREFDPSGYQQMSQSMKPLINGIKVAFLTSIYGIALSLSYSMMLSNIMGELEQMLEMFLEKYYFLQKKKKEPYHELIVGQQQQTQVIKDWTETFSIQLADRLEEVMLPTFAQLEEQLGKMADNQEEALIRAGEKSAEQFRKTFFESLSKLDDPLEKIETLQLQYIKALELSSEKLDNSVSKGQEALQEVILDIKRCFIDCAQILHENIESQTKAVENYGLTAEKAGESLTANSQSLNEQVWNFGKNIEIFTMGIEKLSNEMSNFSKKMQVTSESVAVIGQTGQEFLNMMRDMQILFRKMEKELEKYESCAAALMETVSREAAAASADVPDKQNVRNEWDGQKDWNEQKALMRELIKEVKVLSELERKRQERSFFNRIFRRK